MNLTPIQQRAKRLAQLMNSTQQKVFLKCRNEMQNNLEFSATFHTLTLWGFALNKVRQVYITDFEFYCDAFNVDEERLIYWLTIKRTSGVIALSRLNGKIFFQTPVNLFHLEGFLRLVKSHQDLNRFASVWAIEPTEEAIEATLKRHLSVNPFLFV